MAFETHVGRWPLWQYLLLPILSTGSPGAHSWDRDDLLELSLCPGVSPLAVGWGQQSGSILGLALLLLSMDAHPLGWGPGGVDGHPVGGYGGLVGHWGGALLGIQGSFILHYYRRFPPSSLSPKMVEQIKRWFLMTSSSTPLEDPLVQMMVGVLVSASIDGLLLDAPGSFDRTKGIYSHLM